MLPCIPHKFFYATFVSSVSTNLRYIEAFGYNILLWGYCKVKLPICHKKGYDFLRIYIK